MDAGKLAELKPKTQSLDMWDLVSELRRQAEQGDVADFPAQAKDAIARKLHERARRAPAYEDVVRARFGLATLYAAYLSEGTLDSIETLEYTGIADAQPEVCMDAAAALGAGIGDFAWEQAGRDLEEIFHAADLDARWRDAACDEQVALAS